MKRTGRGFTLIELLVVIAIIGTLVGLLSPALISARRQARKTACTNNMDQIGKAFALYSGRYNGYFPGYDGYAQVFGTVVEAPYTATTEGQPRSACRYMAVAVNTKRATSDLVKGRRNFMAVGLGKLVSTENLPDQRTLSCRAYSGGLSTYYEGVGYGYREDVWRRMGGYDPQLMEYGDGTQLEAHNPNQSVIVLSSYSYRGQAYYWPGGAEGDQQELSHTKKKLKAMFMTPTFKTVRALGERAIVSDTFDYNKDNMDQGLGEYGHAGGYNVLYGDGHVKFYNDRDNQIRYWSFGSDGSTDEDLTISGPEGERVWHIFDQAEGYDL